MSARKSPAEELREIAIDCDRAHVYLLDHAHSAAHPRQGMPVHELPEEYVFTSTAAILERLAAQLRALRSPQCCWRCGEGDGYVTVDGEDHRRHWCERCLPIDADEFCEENDQ